MSEMKQDNDSHIPESSTSLPPLSFNRENSLSNDSLQYRPRTNSVSKSPVTSSSTTTTRKTHYNYHGVTLPTTTTNTITAFPDERTNNTTNNKNDGCYLPSSTIPNSRQPSSFSSLILLRVRSTCHAVLFHSSFQWKLLVMGQVLSFLLACTGASQSTLFLDCQLSAPSFMLGLYYFLLSQLLWMSGLRQFLQNRKIARQSPTSINKQSETETKRTKPEKQRSGFTYVTPTQQQTIEGEEEGSENTTEQELEIAPGLDEIPSKDSPNYLLGVIPLKAPALLYLPMAILDFSANFCMLKAFKYTTITSVTLLDALAIPSAMLLSRLFLDRQYTNLHYLGVTCCSVGILLNVLKDYQQDEHEDAGSGVAGSGTVSVDDFVSLEYPQKLRGDLLAIMGGLLMGATNVAGEMAVRRMGGPLEYLGMLGFYCSIVCAIVSSWIERDQIAEFFGTGGDKSETCSERTAWYLLCAFLVSNVSYYVGAARFLQISEAAFFNLSLLTGDIWSVIFSVISEHIVPPSVFFFALIFTISGVVLYEMAPSPVLEDREDAEKVSHGGGGGSHGAHASPPRHRRLPRGREDDDDDVLEIRAQGSGSSCGSLEFKEGITGTDILM